MKVIQVSTFPPEKCGIATYTYDIINYSHKLDPDMQNRVLAINGYRQPNEYGDFVPFLIDKQNKESFTWAAGSINMDDRIKVVSLQHEYGIFGGEEGSHVLDFVNAVEKPIVSTFHTVITGEQWEKQGYSLLRHSILEELGELSDKIIVISNVAKDILIKEYGIDPGKIRVTHHGFHDFDESVEDSKKILGLEDRTILSTVGLLRPKRGMEYVIRALPQVVENHPEILYMIPGSTHPKEIKEGRDPYREMLIREVEALGLENNVQLIDRYLPLESLQRHINASDICITPYLFHPQSSSGVLTYCLGHLKPTVSTPFLYAQEMLADGRGLLSEYKDPDSMAKQINKLLDNPELMNRIIAKLTKFAPHMRWENVARQYLDAYKEVMNN